MSAPNILRTAYGLLGDGQGAEWGLNPEYTRAVLEMVASLVPMPEGVDLGSEDGRDFVLDVIRKQGAPANHVASAMDLIDEIAHRHDGSVLGNLVTDFYLASAETGERYKVTETVQPTLDYRSDYVVSVFGQTGWIEVARMSQDHAEDTTVAAGIAERILTA